MKFSCRRLAVITLGFIFTALPLQAQGFFQTIDWSVCGTLLFFPEKNGAASAPMPILPSLGGAASYTISELLAAEITMDLYGNTYDYDYKLQRVIPANDEFRSAFVMGAVLGFQPVFRFNPKEDKFTIRAYGGLSLDLRMIFRAYGLDDGDPHTNNDGNTDHTLGEARKDITSYFWGGGRFVFLVIGGGMDFPLTENFNLGFDLRIWIPPWRIWTGENAPFIEGFRFGLGFRLGFK